MARAMMRECEARGAEVAEVDLGRRPDLDAVLARLGPDARETCLLVGSPVYVNHAAPPVMDFIARLPAGTGIPVIPFVTYGAVSSGMALFEMGAGLAARVIKGLCRGDLVPLDPAARAEMAKTTLREVSSHLPPRVVDEACI